MDPVSGQLIHRVLLCARYVRGETRGPRASTSLPGHLIQLCLEGHTRHEIGGRHYDIKPGDLMWYHEDELVRVEILKPPYVFYTLNFVAPALEPPAVDQRVRPVNGHVRARFDALHEAWGDDTADPHARQLQVMGCLYLLLAELTQPGGKAFRMDPAAQLWWDLETKLRQDLSQPISMPWLEAASGVSASTIHRACQHALGMPPMRRVKQIRMSFARGLVRRSDLPMTQIARRLGYLRVHEFSRDYRKHFGLPATEDRQR